MIRNFILSQMSLNRYGLFQFLKKQESQHQKQFLDLQQQYKNTKSSDKQLDIMKSIVNISQQIDGKDNISLETVQSYYQFINDYQKCERKRFNINSETKELYKQIHQQFLDQNIFNKIKAKSNFNQKSFLQLNSLIYLFEEKIQQYQLEEIHDIIEQLLYLKYFLIRKIVQIAQVLDLQPNETQKLQVAILTTYQIGFFQNITGFYQDSVVLLNKNLDLIQKYKKLPQQQQDEQVLSITDEEWLFSNELKTLRLLAYNYGKLNQNEMCIKYQDKTLQHIKSHEGITQEYIYTLYNFNNMFAQLNQYRQLKIINETCRDLEINKEYFFLQFQKLKILYYLEQLTKQEYDRIINLHQKMQMSDDNFQTIVKNLKLYFKFHSVLLQCAIRLKQYSEVKQQIDLMFSYITTISDEQLETIVGQRRSLYQEFQNKKFNHNKNIYEKTIIYYQEKAYPHIEEIQKQFSENYFNSSLGRQRELNGQMLTILKDYMYRSIYSNDQQLIRVALETTVIIYLLNFVKFKLCEKNRNYREPLLFIFQILNELEDIQPQIKTQLSKYTQQLGQQ